MPKRGQPEVSDPNKLICPRHKVETPLTCVTCETPICPECYVRTAVGLRCPVCAQGVTVKIGKRPTWPFALAGVAVLLAVGLVALTSGGGGNEDTGNPTEEVAGTEKQAATGYRFVNRPDLGYSVEVPFDWQEAPDNSNTTVAYTQARSNEGSLRVTTGPTDASLGDIVSRLVADLTAQGGRDFVRTDTQVSGSPAVRLTYLFPSSPTPGSVLATHTSYKVIKNAKQFSFQLSTTDPGAKDSVFQYMATKFTLL